MKRLYSVLSAVMLCLMLLVGVVALFDKDPTYSETEKRGLAARPSFSLSAFFDGSFNTAFSKYFSDTFPQREMLLAANKSLNGFYYSSLFTKDGDASLIVDMGDHGANGGASLNPSDAIDPSASSEPSEPTSDASDDPSNPSDPEAPTEPTDPTKPTINDSDTKYPPEDEKAQDLGAAIVVGNRAMDVPYMNKSVIDKYAESVNAIAAALGSNVRTFNIAVPNAAAFYAPEAYRTGSCYQPDMIDYCYSKLASNVTAVDAYSAIAPHTDEYIYFRTDHHWTQLGSYYAYTAFCKAAGFEAKDISLFEKGQYDNFKGSMCTFLANYPQVEALKNNPDTLYFYRPIVEAKARYYEDATLSPEYVIGVISYISDSVSNKYLTYAGGDHPIVIVRTDVEGPVCMLIKESYGNAFMPWLTSHYSKIILVDPREFNRNGKPDLDLVAFAREQGVNDCIVLDYTFMLNSENYTTWLKRLVNAD